MTLFLFIINVISSLDVFKTTLEQRTGSKLGKECIIAVYCHPAFLTYMQNTSCEMLS